MRNPVGCKNKCNIKIADLTEKMLAEAVAVFINGGWDADSIKSVKAEMLAFIKGDIEGYIRQRFIVVLLNDRIAGVAAWAPSMCSFSMYELSWATVLPEWRHQGINTLMLNERIARIRAHHGPKPFQVLVYTWDNPMYAGTGFSRIYPYSECSGNSKRKYVFMAQFGEGEEKAIL